MFATLKNKIKEETGNEVPAIPVRLSGQQRYQRSTFDSTSSTSIENLSIFEQKDAEISALKLQCSDVNGKLIELTQQISNLQEDNKRLEKSNQILDESVKVAQLQKELIHDENDKIQNIQLQEISKLKSLLNFREQEGVDQLSIIKQQQHHLDQLKQENGQLRELESQKENIQDDFEKLRHSSQIEKNHYQTSLAVLEEQNRHLISKLNIYEESRIKFTMNLNKEEKIQALLQERKLLEQRLEEAHLHLTDIKSSWSAQNLALETQVSRLSRQVAAETTEKRKAVCAQDDQVEKIKEFKFQLEKYQNELTQRDNKIKLQTEVIDDLSSTLKELRLENEEEILFLHSKVKQITEENEELQNRLLAADERTTNSIEKYDSQIQTMLKQSTELKEDIKRLNNELKTEQNEHRNDMLKNAEISQELSIMKQDLKNEWAEVQELNETLQKLQSTIESKDDEIKSLENKTNELNDIIKGLTIDLVSLEEMSKEMIEKNKTIKVLKQRLSDFKKTLQNELKNNHLYSASFDGCSSSSNINTNPNNNYNSDNKITTEIPNTFGRLSRSLSVTTTPTTTLSSLTKPIPDITNTTIGNNNHHTKLSGINNTTTSVITTNNHTKPQIIMDEVNFKYLKHVILKFLTSREVEARHLIRAVGTLLNLNKDEEKLLHDTLSFKMSWFGTRPESKITSFT